MKLSFKNKSGKIAFRDLLATLGSGLFIGLAVLWVACQFVKPAPPRTVVMSTGAEDGAYHKFGRRYQEILKKSGIQLELKTSAGSLDNLKRLDDAASGVSVALVQGGLSTPERHPGLISLGTVFNEPLWVFYRGGVKIDRLSDLKGKKVAIGPEGSGLRALAMQLLEASGLSEPTTTLLGLTTKRSAEALMSGEADAVFVVAAAESETVQRLIRAEGISLMNLAQADGYTRRFPFLSSVTLPEGTIDFGRNIPPADVHLLAARASLVARADLHPALAYAFLDAAERIHNRSGIFERSGDFPSDRDTDLPLSDEARRFHKSGRPFLQRYLPFWVAVFIDRILVMLLPLVAVLFPVFKILPNIYTWRVKARIYRHYGELRFLEEEVDNRFDPSRRPDYLTRLEEIERTANRTHTPLSYSDLLYNLRMHIQIVRQKVLKPDSD